MTQRLTYPTSCTPEVLVIMVVGQVAVSKCASRIVEAG
jgi:hypothetical protein